MMIGRALTIALVSALMSLSVMPLATAAQRTAAPTVAPGTCINVTMRNITGLLVSTWWLNAWIAGPPIINLSLPWGVTGTWDFASSRTVSALVDDAAAGSTFSLIVPAFVTRNYANRTVQLEIYDVNHARGVLMTDYFVNESASFDPDALAPIVMVRGLTQVLVDTNVTTVRREMFCVLTLPVISNFSSARWLALQQAASLNASVVLPTDPPVIMMRTANDTATDISPAADVRTTLILFVAIVSGLVVASVIGGVLVYRSLYTMSPDTKSMDPGTANSQSGGGSVPATEPQTSTSDRRTGDTVTFVLNLQGSGEVPEEETKSQQQQQPATEATATATAVFSNRPIDTAHV